MKITLDQIGKRYNYDWIFREIDKVFLSGKRYALTGPNGSGKSTLLQIISGSLAHSEGRVTFAHADLQIAEEEIYKHISLVAPYMELIEEFNLSELFEFQAAFKPFYKGLSFREMAETVGLKKVFKRPVADYSSGMKQRAKLAMAFFADVPVLLLDEPCSNLDEEGFMLYRELMKKYTGDKLTIISSNNAFEYEGSDEIIKITDFK